jgi:hypothetical protein
MIEGTKDGGFGGLSPATARYCGFAIHSSLCVGAEATEIRLE